MPALELLTGFVTAPGATLTQLTMAAGNSNTIRNAALDSKIRLLTCWADNQAAGVLRVRSPRLHDNVQGIRMQVVASQPMPLLPPRYAQSLVAQDTLTLELSGSGTAGDIETACFLVAYENLPGVEARFITSEDLRSRGRDVVTVENTLSLGTAGGYSGEEAINAEFDLLKANTDYAIAGYIVSAEAACVRYRGVDTGNLGIGGPANPDFPHFTREFFIWLSEAADMPLIPVFNSANKAGLLIDGAQDENGTDITVSTILVELS
jgi:hypothetical protein